MVNGAARYGTDGALTLDVVFLDDMVQSIDWQSAQPVTADAAMAERTSTAARRCSPGQQLCAARAAGGSA